MAFALAPSNRLILHFEDDNGKHSTMDFYVPNTDTDPAGGGPAAISVAAAAISDAALYETELMIIAENASPGSPTTGDYDRPADKAALKFNAADGSFVNMQVGGPKAAIFSNAWDVNPSGTGMPALIAAMVANAVTQEGEAITSFHEGHRRRPPRRKGQ